MIHPRKKELQVSKRSIFFILQKMGRSRVTSPLGTGFKSVLYLKWTGVQIQTGPIDVGP